MNVTKGSKVGLICADGATIEYETRESVSLAHLIDTLRRLEAIDGDQRAKSGDSESRGRS